MAIQKGHRFTIEFSDAFPRGMVLMGELAPDNEYQSREDRAAGRPVRQKVDELTGKRQWKGTVTDPDERNAKRASFEITFLADVQPVPTTAEVLPGMRQIELDGLTAKPRLARNGEFKYQSFVFRSTGFRPAGSAAKPHRPARPLALSPPTRPRETRHDSRVNPGGAGRGCRGRPGQLPARTRRKGLVL